MDIWKAGSELVEGDSENKVFPPILGSIGAMQQQLYLCSSTTGSKLFQEHLPFLSPKRC